MVMVATLRVAPVKGLATVPVDDVFVERAGVAEDRRLFLLDQRGAVVTLRTHPGLIRATPELDVDTQVLRVRLPGGTTASQSVAGGTQRASAALFGRNRTGTIVDGDVAHALSELAGEPLRLVLAGEVGAGWDEGPVSILGRASALAVGGPGDAARYRMLVELDGTAPYEEDTWVGHQVQLGQATVRVTQQLKRCVVITRSPTTGEHEWDGLRALARAGREQLCLGVIAEVVRPGQVSVGDRARVTGRG